MKRDSPPKTGRIFQPYATQLLPFGKLKFWFAMIDDETGEKRRYELSFTRGSNTPTARFRPFLSYGSPRNSSNFYDYVVPDEIQSSPYVTFPRFKGDKISEAAKSILSDPQIVDLTSFRLVGTISPQPKPEPSLLPLMAYNGDQDAP